MTDHDSRQDESPEPSEGGPKKPKQPGEGSLKRRAITGSLFNAANYGGNLSLRLVSQIILTRLLAPEVFGVMTLVNLLQQGLKMFSDVGIGPSIVRAKSGEDPNYLNTAWTIQVMRGFALWIIACILAKPFSLFYPEAEGLEYYIPVASITAVIAGFFSTNLYLIKRKLALGRVLVMELGSMSISIAVTVVWAMVTPSVWALVAGGLVGTLFRLAITHLWFPGPGNRFHWDREAARDLFGFGRWIFLTTLLSFVSLQLDKLLMGKLFSMAVLGVYGRADALASIPRLVMERQGSAVFFPALSEINRRDDRQAMRVKIRRYRWIILALLGLLVGGMVGVGDLFAKLIYPEQFEGAAWMLVFLAGGIWFRALLALNAAALLTIGQPKFYAIGSVFRVILVAGGMVLGHMYFGVPGAIVAIACSDIPLYLFVSLGLVFHKLTNFTQDFVMTVAVAGFITLIVLGRLYFGLDMPWADALVELRTATAPGSP